MIAIQVVTGSDPADHEGVQVIDSGTLLKLDSRTLFSSFVNNSPGDGMETEINPSRFRWYYVLCTVEQDTFIRPYNF